ncbi:PREDICTED: chymotrypsin-2-like [Ceratosolen solmsi marchali]|uniref:Chymotrypsin-2-like n=1 Tax=Ceratosolen solmsi marchali TaxID=326594 RepID=A0AAJ6YB90_9HYME|nr:PREDICTED: chymotrypsin-2-like [Ceratosolen solmsi marchali]
MNLQLFLCLSLTLSIEVLGKKSRIIGGESADIEEFPFMISLRLVDNNRHICGGTILTERHILTAAHCLTGISNIHTALKVQAGSTYLSSNNATIYNVSCAYIHPLFTGKISLTSQMQHDIAIILLGQLINFNDVQNKVELPTEDVKHGSSAEFIGWGALFYPPRSLSDQLQKTPMSIITYVQCSRYIRYYLRKEQFCGFEDKGIGACMGDSGGPLVINGKIIGINSYVFPCALGLPDVYINVYSYLRFIRQIIARDQCS